LLQGQSGMTPEDTQACTVRYAIQPERNIGTPRNTQHIPCADAEAGIFVVYRLNEVPGDADWVADFWTRAEAEDYIHNQITKDVR
jgi:hypothetical protein